MNFGGDDPAAKPWQKQKTVDTSKAARTDQKEDSGEDMDIDDDDEDGDRKSKDASRRVKHMDDAESSAFDAKLEDFAKVTVPRRRLERWCNEPFFQAAILECFVRILIGEDENGEKVYRLCEIVDVKATGKSYKFPVVDKTKKPVSTSSLLRLKFGTSERDFPMYLVSDAPPTEADVQKYITAQKNSRLEVLSRRRATKLRRLQDDLISNYTYTTEDIEKNLQQKKKSGKTNTNLGSETTRNAIAVKAARDAVTEAEQKLAEAKKALLEFSGNPAEESKLEDRVHDCTDAVKDAKKNLEERLEEEKVTLGAAKDRKQKLANRSKDMNWAKVNERAVQMNQQADREGYKALKEAEPAKPPGKQEELNLYARRRVKPKVLWKVASDLRKEEEEDETKREEKKEDVVVKTKQPLQQHQKPITDLGSPPSLIQENHKAAALSDSHQFAIDEEGLVQSSVLGSFGLDGTVGSSKVVNRRKRPRKGLSLSQYLDLKAKEVLL
jgi:RNA polymerase-associated protein RTF1